MLELIHIVKDYYVDKKPYPALKDVSLAFLDKGFVSILGPSGCGKTTMLNIIGGLDHYSSGDLLIDGKSTKDFSDAEWDAYRNERVGFVFQSYNLIPHQTILSNVETGLMLNGVPRQERKERALKALESVGLVDVAKKRPNQLSGGQMQRVALARALVNNPKIVLADEPTGALDSVTSKQVMELLKEASKTRLVVMVTHNQELAYAYSDRIIKMKDGQVEDDSKPVPISTRNDSPKEITKKTSMSFFTALKSSWANIRTKKGRTILTAIASSIGIIGVALVLAVSNGFSLYVDKVESGVAGSVPISITPVTYTYKESTERYEIYPKEEEVKVYDSSSALMSMHQNRFSKEYFDYIEKAIEKGWASSIMYNRQNLNFNLLTDDPDKTSDGVKTVNQYRSAGATAGAVSSVTGLPMTIFHELYGSSLEMAKWYDCIAGRMPTSKDEIVLITDRYNRVEKSTLTALGIISPNSQSKTISFNDILYNEATGSGKTYKVYRNSDLYKNIPYYEKAVDSYKITGFDVESLKVTGEKTTSTIRYFESQPDAATVYQHDEIYNPLKLKVVGVIRSREDSYISLMPSSLGYLSELKDYLADDGQTISSSPELRTAHERLLNAAKGNVYYRYDVDENGDPTKDDSLYKLNALISEYYHSYNLGDMIQRFEETGKLTEADASTLSTLLTNLPSNIASCLSYRDFWGNEKNKEGVPNFTNSHYYFQHCQNVGCDLLQGEVDIPSFSNADSSSAMEGVGKLVGKITDPSFWNDVNNNERTSWCLIDFLALENNFSIITSVLIFPASLTTKESLTKYLSDYNVGKEDSETIVYSDVMGSFTDSLGVLIQVISVVLIVFASISLVVSSIMTGIITYVSVVERTKEIGILRACGARKKDVGRLFEAECVIIGAMAGIIGVGFSAIACLPISAIIDHQFPGNGLESIASLSPWHALLLIAIAIVLAFVSGLIPARIAAKKDPVTALRTE